MAKRLLENNMAEKEADRIGAQFAGSNDVMGDMGKTFNFDFSNVKLHGGEEGASMAASHGDLAYAQGNHAYFGADILNQHTPEANMAVGHELTHVMQQNEGAGVSEHVPFGESQGLGFFGKVKGFFRNLFMGKKEKQKRQEIFDTLRYEGNYNSDDKYESTDNLQLLKEQRRDQRIKDELVEGLKSDGLYEQGDENKSIPELQKQLYDARAIKALDTGNMLDVVELTEADTGVETSFTEENREELSSVTNIDWERARADQQEAAAADKLDTRFKYGFASEVGAQMISSTEGLQTALMLIKNTQLYKTLESVYENRGLDKRMFTRLFHQVRPVYLDDKGDFVSARDKENHEWNIAYLKSVTINPEDTAFVDSYFDEILSMESVVKDIVENGESAAIANFEILQRMQYYPLTFDQYMNTRVVKSYFKAQNGGVEPASQEQWPTKVKAAAALTSVIGDLALRYNAIQAKNGVVGDVSNLHFTNKDKTVDGQAKADLGKELGEEFLQMTSGQNWSRYETAKREFLADGGVMPQQVSNAQYKRQPA